MGKFLKRRIILLIAVAIVAVLAGCGRRDAASLERQLEYRQAGLDQLAQRQYAEAVVSFQTALDQSLAVIGNLEIDIAYYKALAQYRSGDITGAINTYSALIEYNDSNALAFYLRGSLYMQQGELQRGGEDFQSALEHGKNDFELFIVIAQEMRTVGLEAEADDILRRTLNWTISSAESYRNLGYIHYLLGDYAMARQNLDRAAGQNDTLAVLYLAQVYEAEGNTEQANSLYETYVGQNSGDPVSLNQIGLRRMEEGSLEQALASFRAGLALEDPLNAQSLRRNEIAVLERLSRFAEARERMNSYVADYPEDGEAAREYIFLQTR